MTYSIDSEYARLCRMIDDHEVISFDVYDTALLRNVLYPTDLFDLVAMELRRKDIPVPQFKASRIRAEEKARSRATAEDIGLDDIYEVIAEQVGDRLASEIKETELLIEERFTIANPFMKRVYDYARQQNKCIIFTSDMYLGKRVIGTLLLRNGYDGYHELFVSSDLGISKASSNLYRYVRETLKDYRAFLHIGDNHTSDYVHARQSGFTAYHYPSLRERVAINGKYSIEYSIMKAIQINYSLTREDISYWEKFGVNVVSSLFFGHANWLVGQLKGKDHVYFLSRDGYLPYRIYEMFARYVDGPLPEARYLHASRRAYQVPNIIHMERQQALELLTAYNSATGQRLTLGEIFDNIGLDRDKYLGLIRRHGIEHYRFEIRSARDQDKVKEILDAVYPDIIGKFQAEADLLRRYLEQHSLYEHQEINIVDIGWRCSAQKAIQDMTGIRTSGYYFGTAHNVYEDIRDRVYGYAFQLGNPYRTMNRIMDNVMMYELIFSAPHGSLIGFREEGDAVVPILKNLEQNEYLYQCMDAMQAGVLNIMESYLQYYDYLKNVETQDCLRDYMSFIDDKNYEDLLEFSKLTGVVGIGDTQEVHRYVTITSIREYRAHKRKIEADIRKNLWKGALIIRGSITEFHHQRRSMQRWKNMIGRAMALIIKGIRNPGKALQFIRRFMKAAKTK